VNAFTRRRLVPTLLLVKLGWPLVRAAQPYADLREDFVQAARTARHPELYLDGVSLAAMGGEPYAVWS
jgi:hypothetical protein